MGRLLRKKVTRKKRRDVDGSEGVVKSEIRPSGMNVERSEREIPKKLVFPRKSTDQQKNSLIKAAKKNYFDKVLQFLREVKVEFKKVTWPTRKQTTGSTVVVIALVIIIASFLGLVDVGLNQIIRLVLK